jgi:hypothetical protein
MFYCLGGEGWQLSDPHDSNYRKMADALQAILGQGLPNELNTYEEITGQSLTSNLIDPLDAAENMERALEELFVQPFAARFPLGAAPSTGESPLNAPSLNGELFDFFTSMVDRIEAVEPEAAAQILADLETLEMIVMTGLEDPQNLLNEIRSRYIGADLDTIERQMGEFVGKLIDDT